ncbi:HutD/Ves family protein [Flexivirga sp.]|uniref:HutD/Ves family protein n=1 Tax=Flexivirga sp. TaxID=1962927 RepID=UPI003F80F32E
MSYNIIRFADATTMPWLGGGGITHELARHPAEGDFAWRLSVAEVQQDGAFSRLDGVDRVIVLCSPGRMVLHTPEPQPLERFSPYAFDGGTQIDCTVPDGPTRDFNVMTRRGVYVADVTTVVGARREVEVPTDAEVFVFCMDGVLSGGVELGTFDLAQLDARTTVDASHGAAAVVVLTTMPLG